MIVKHKLSINLRCQNEGFLNIVKCIKKCVKKFGLRRKLMIILLLKWQSSLTDYFSYILQIYSFLLAINLTGIFTNQLSYLFFVQAFFGVLLGWDSFISSTWNVGDLASFWNIIAFRVNILLHDWIIWFVDGFRSLSWLFFTRLLATLLLRRLAGIAGTALALARFLCSRWAWHFDNDLTNRLLSGCWAGNIHEKLSEWLFLGIAVVRFVASITTAFMMMMLLLEVWIIDWLDLNIRLDLLLDLWLYLREVDGIRWVDWSRWWRSLSWSCCWCRCKLHQKVNKVK